MLAARYLGPSLIEPVEVPLPELSTGEALIKVNACGFCGSDLGIVAGVHPRAREPLTIGHEFSGVIHEIRGSSEEWKAGDWVTAFPLITCGQCFVCRNGLPHVCRTLRLYGFDVDGAMAEYIRLPLSALVKLPPEMSPHVGALIEPLAVATHGVSLANLEGVSTAIVIGAGPIGLLTALVARARGISNVLVSDILPSRLALAERLGFRAVQSGPELQETVLAESDGEGADLVFECAGVPAAARLMTNLTRSRGVIINLGVFKKPAEVDLQAVNFKELSILGSRVYTRGDFEEAVKLAAALPIEHIVSHTFPLKQVREAFDCFREGDGVCKVLILPNGSHA